ncbi:50S ribosomal protein L9 [SAR86 cluster bacterium]|jgi:large subunit ribosomal protein L9|nr:50S ribosomal protein L9 [SAR86 cluster bacterium]|tara:strand:+ start:6385 stop:6834 length:450 start_codon:yes stop_codon:yes gene_type:complete
MKVILKETITGLGAPGDLVNVKAGYGRNFLMPSGKAIPATEENLKVYEAEKAQIAEIENKKITEAKDLDNKLSGFTLEIQVAVTEEEVMYGSIGTKEISESLIENGFEIDRQAIRLPEGVLKDLGNFELDIELHPEVISKINVLLKPEK